MEEVIRVADQFYILATSPRIAERRLVLKDADTFGVFDPAGDIHVIGQSGQGLYHEGTRFLSRLEFRLADRRPFLLGSTVKENNAVLSVHLTNPDVHVDGEVVLPRNTVHVHREIFLWSGACHQRFLVRNYGRAPVDATVSFAVDSDFADVFEVRGATRQRRGRVLPPETGPRGITLAYEGLDGVSRRTRVELAAPGALVTPSTLRVAQTLPPRGEGSFTMIISFATGRSEPERHAFDEALQRATAGLERLRAGSASVGTTNVQLDEWIARSMADLHMMVTRLPEGDYPYAGIPWYSTVFGRDGIIAAMQHLWVKPELARGVLSVLAATQAREVVPEEDAEPGKILHERRSGEMAALREIPFGRYYGSVDATPLFVMLAGAYYQHTADKAFIESIWPNIERALDWMDRYGDLDGDGFVEYLRRSPKGLIAQGWRDSFDAVFHQDGTLAEPPVALCEAQAYAYAARMQASELAETLGMKSKAIELHRKAQALQLRFEETFWSEELSTYVPALDGAKRPCRVRASTAGHALFAGIAGPERARRVAETLMSEPFYSGWGIRTVAATETRYNPMSYHNGSVWPHDNALIALGFSRYGIARERIAQLLSGLFDASVHSDLRRLPELFCGFPRQPGVGPTQYPVACAPQAWSAGCVFMLLQACLGMTVDAPHGQVRFSFPYLPESVEGMFLRDLRVGRATIDIDVQRHPRDVGVYVVRRDGPVEIVVVK